MKAFGWLALAACLWASGAASQVTVVSQAPYSPAGAQQFVLQSQKLGRSFLVVITPPTSPLVPGMKAPGANEKLPTVYALDGGYGVAGPLAQMLSLSGVTTPAYVVSISYPPGAGRRDTDLLFRPVTEGGRTYGGGGAAFLAFLTDELQPFLEARFPLDPQRAVLFGHSFGGLFAANVLAEAPEAFSGYVIASASVWRDPGLPQRLAAKAPTAGPRRVLVAAGDREEPRMLAGTRQIAEALNAKGSNLSVESRVFEGGNHLSYYPNLTQAGLAWTLPSNPARRTPTAVSAEALEMVVGSYALLDGRRSTVSRRNGALVLQLSDSAAEVVLLAETPRRFFAAGEREVLVTFDGPEGKAAKVMTLKTDGATTRARRRP